MICDLLDLPVKCVVDGIFICLCWQAGIWSLIFKSNSDFTIVKYEYLLGRQWKPPWKGPWMMSLPGYCFKFLALRKQWKVTSSRAGNVPNRLSEYWITLHLPCCDKTYQFSIESCPMVANSESSTWSRNPTKFIVPRKALVSPSFCSIFHKYWLELYQNILHLFVCPEDSTLAPPVQVGRVNAAIKSW